MSGTEAEAKIKINKQKISDKIKSIWNCDEENN
jgi:hypothetical protein